VTAFGIRFDFPGNPQYVALADTGALIWSDSTTSAIRFEDSVDAVRVLLSYHPALADCAQVVELEAP
jgi:hypothetical protein